MAVLSGCGRAAAPPAGQAAAKPHAASRVQRGPVRLSVVVEPSPARLSDEPTLTLEIAYPEGVTIRKPEFGTALGEFILRDFREPLPCVEDDRQVLRQIYTLKPTRAGKFVIDPIAVTFSDHRAGSGEEHTIETDPITVEVAAAAAQEAPSLDKLRALADPVVLPQPHRACGGGAFSDRSCCWWRAAPRGGSPAADPAGPRADARRAGRHGAPAAAERPGPAAT